MYFGSFDKEYANKDSKGKLARIAANRKYLVREIKKIADNKTMDIPKDIRFKTGSYRLNFLTPFLSKDNIFHSLHKWFY